MRILKKLSQHDWEEKTLVTSGNEKGILRAIWKM